MADTTVQFDRRVKLPVYARANIPEVWIVDIGASAIEVYGNPSGGEYTTSSRLGPGDEIAPAAFPDMRFRAGEVFGPK